MKDWLRVSLGWDGVLPLAVIAVPLLVRTCLPGGHPAVVLTCFLLPLFMALTRCVVGVWQIEARCGGARPALRQVALAVAIVLLLLCEALTTAGVFAKDLPASFWLACGTLYVGYLIFAGMAFMPGASRERALLLSPRLAAPSPIALRDFRVRR